jgi:hypothetical protein
LLHVRDLDRGWPQPGTVCLALVLPLLLLVGFLLLRTSRGPVFDPAVPRLFIIDGSKALAWAIQRSFGRNTAIQRCQIHKAPNIMERLPKPPHTSVRRALRQAWELNDAA